MLIPILVITFCKVHEWNENHVKISMMNSRAQSSLSESKENSCASFKMFFEQDCTRRERFTVLASYRTGKQEYHRRFYHRGRQPPQHSLWYRQLRQAKSLGILDTTIARARDRTILIRLSNSADKHLQTLCLRIAVDGHLTFGYVRHDLALPVPPLPKK